MITTDEFLGYCDTALDQYAAVCRELGDDRLSVRPDTVPGANSAFGLVAHVVGVMARWGRTVNRGVVVPRDRDAEFTATGSVEEALALLEAGRAALHEDVAAAAPNEAPAAPPPGRDRDDPGLRTQGGVLLHVYEELAQHLGQLEVLRDVLLAPRGSGSETGGEYVGTDRFRGARFLLSDFTGAQIRDADVSGLKVVDCLGADVSLGGDFERLLVNDVDVTAYVEGELDRRHPVRRQAREATSPEDYRAAWDAVEAMWAATVDRARHLPEAALQQRVDDEWSFVETQRHLLFAADAWLGSCVLEEDAPYHPLGFPSSNMPDDEAAAMGLTLGASTTLDEVLGARRARMDSMRRTVDALTEAELDRVCSRKPADPYPDREYVVHRCLEVVLKEEAEHHRYATRDLAVLEPGGQPPRA